MLQHVQSECQNGGSSWWAWGAMRLICPNCGAQYEVDDNVIPPAGRDVQCSACGHTWFQQSPEAMAETAASADPDGLPSHEEWGAIAAIAEPPPDAAAGAAPPDAAPEGYAGTDATTDLSGDDGTDDDTGAAETEATRRMLDESLLAILREEAEREARARRAEGRSLETQPDLGLAPLPAALAARAAAVASPSETTAAAERSARLRPDPSESQDAEGARRDRLPDIEVINSTLRASSERGGAGASLDAPETRARRRAGFRLGFVAVVLLVAGAMGVYAYAPRIAVWAPPLEPVLLRYVAAVDASRIWLDTSMAALIARLQADS